MHNRQQIIRLLSTDINNLMRTALQDKDINLDLAMQAKAFFSNLQINEALDFIFKVFKHGDLQKFGFYRSDSSSISLENKHKATLLYFILVHYHQAYYQTLNNMIVNYQKMISRHLPILITCINDMIEYNNQVQSIKNQLQSMPWLDDEPDSDEVIIGSHTASYLNSDFVVANQETLQCEANLLTLRQYVINYMDSRSNSVALKLQALKVANAIEEELRSCVTSPQIKILVNVIDCLHTTLGQQTLRNVKLCIHLANQLCKQVDNPRLKILGGLLKCLAGAVLYGMTFGCAGYVTMQRGIRLFASGKKGLKTPQLVQALQEFKTKIKKFPS